MKFNSVTIPESLRGVVIKTKYLGATDYRDARIKATHKRCLLYTSPSPRDLSTSRMPSSA